MDVTIRHPETADEAPAARLSERDIREGVGARNLERARLYRSWGAVFDARRSGDELAARCEGSSEESYRVRVRLGVGGVEEASCSCPVGERGACKHTGAVLLAWVEEPSLFAEAPSLDEALASLDRASLLALVRALLARRPELEPAVESLLPARPAPVAPRADDWRARAALAFRRNESPAAVAREIQSLVAEGEARGEGDVSARAALHEQVALAAVGRWRRLGPDAAPVLAVARASLDALGACVAAAPDAASRMAALRALVSFFRFDIEQGSATGYAPSPGRHAVALAAARATDDERRALATAVRDEMERAEAYARRAWSVALLDLEEGLVDDGAWLAQARSLQRHGAAARRLARIGRGDEALAEAASAHDAELVEVAEALAANALGAEAERLVAARMGRASEANRARMSAWLRGRAEARRDAQAEVLALEAEFRARPELAAYDALRDRATARGLWAESEARTHAWLEDRGHPLLLDVLLRDGRLDEALRVALGEKLRATHAVTQKRRLAEALEESRPRDALELHRRLVDAHVAQRSRPHYREACRSVTKALLLHARLGDAAGGAAWVEALRARYAGLPAFQQELAATVEPEPKAA